MKKVLGKHIFVHLLYKDRFNEQVGNNTIVPFTFFTYRIM